MSFESRVSDFASSAHRASASRFGERLGRLFRRRLPGLLPRLRRFAPADVRRSPGGPPPAQRPSAPSGGGPESRGANPAAFFAPDFLKKIERLRLVAKRLTWAGAKGEHPSTRKGFSLEFSDYRRYQKGDDLRYVDWNVYRRLERLLVKIFTAEEEMNVYLLVDTSRSMAEGAPPKIDYARSVAAALGYIGLKNLDRVGAAAFSSDVVLPLAPGRGRKQILALFGFLQRLACGGATDLRAAARSFAALFPRPGLVVLVSDLFDPAGCRAGLEELAKQRHQLLVIHLLDEGEMRPEPRGDVSLFDVERGGERRLFLDADLARRFERELRLYFEEIETFCSGRRIDYLRTTTRTPFDEFVLSALRQVRSVR